MTMTMAANHRAISDRSGGVRWPLGGITIAAPWVRAVVGAAERRGASRERLLGAGGLTVDGLDAGMRVPFAAMTALWTAAAHETRDPDIGLHVGEAMTTRALGVVGYALENSGSLQDAVDRCTRYSPLLDTGDFGVALEDGKLWVRFQSDGLHWVAEASMASTVAILGQLAGHACRPEIVRFQHAKPRRTAEHERLFGHTMSFGHDRPEVAFDAHEFDATFGAADSRLASYLDRFADEALDGLSTTGSATLETRAAIERALLTGLPLGIDRVSRCLGVSARTLHRRLRSEGTSFRALRGPVQCEHAKGLLQRESATIAEIACCTGFSDASAFTRAFRRWVGESPHAYRLRRL